MHSSPSAKCIPVGRRAPACPHPHEPQSSSAQGTGVPLLSLSPTLSLSSSTTEALLAVHRQNGPAGEELQSHHGGHGPAQVPFPGMCRFPTVRAPRSQLTDVVSHLGFATCSAKSSQHPCASLSRQLPPPLLHNSIFRAGATCSASAGAGSRCPAQPLEHPSFYCYYPSA